MTHGCEFCRAVELERRPANALNVELGTPQARCTLRPPDGRGVTRDGGTLDWLRSGGSILAYGLCDCGDPARCGRRTETVGTSGQAAGMEMADGETSGQAAGLAGRAGA